MDKKFVKRKINEYFGRYEYKELLDIVAEAVIQAHQEEIAALEHRYKQANQIDRDTAGMAVADMKLAFTRIREVEARLAVMAEALSYVADATRKAYFADEEAKANGAGIEERSVKVIEALGECSDRARKALASTIKVLARLNMRLSRAPASERILVATGEEAWLALGTLEFERVYDVLVLAEELGCSWRPEQMAESEQFSADRPLTGNAEKAKESEQGYKRARGVLPWHEGDELPEDVIARVRGRGQESEQ